MSESTEITFDRFCVSAFVQSSSDFDNISHQELNRPGRKCVVVENANACSSQEDRLKIMNRLISKRKR